MEMIMMMMRVPVGGFSPSFTTPHQRRARWSLERLYESRLCICGESYAAGPSYHNSHDDIACIFSFFGCKWTLFDLRKAYFICPFFVAFWHVYQSRRNSHKVTSSCQWVSLLQVDKKKVFLSWMLDAHRVVPLGSVHFKYKKGLNSYSLPGCYFSSSYIQGKNLFPLCVRASSWCNFGGTYILSI